MFNTKIFIRKMMLIFSNQLFSAFQHWKTVKITYSLFLHWNNSKILFIEHFRWVWHRVWRHIYSKPHLDMFVNHRPSSQQQQSQARLGCTAADIFRIFRKILWCGKRSDLFSQPFRKSLNRVVIALTHSQQRRHNNHRDIFMCLRALLSPP